MLHNQNRDDDEQAEDELVRLHYGDDGGKLQSIHCICREFCTPLTDLHPLQQQLIH